MAHTLAAVFDDRKDAEGARERLINAGFDRSCIRLNDSNSRYADASDAGTTSTTGTSLDTGSTSVRSDDDDRSFMDSVREFFSGLFGEEDDRHIYAEAVTRGYVVLTVQSGTQDEIERAADLVEACGPIDIDERKGQWTSSGWTGAAAASTAMSRQASASMQSGAGSVQGSSTGASQQRMEGAGSVQRSAGEATRSTFPQVDENQGLGMRSLDRGGVRLFQHGENRLGDDLPSRAQVGSQTYSEPNDEQFRSHWQSNYASSGTSYDDFAPAYQYGYTMAGNDTYRGRQWDDAETGLRSDWERQHPDSAWDRFKAAVRHGWDRMTS